MVYSNFSQSILHRIEGQNKKRLKTKQIYLISTWQYTNQVFFKNLLKTDEIALKIYQKIKSARIDFTFLHSDEAWAIFSFVENFIKRKIGEKKLIMLIILIIIFNPFVPNASFLYSLKISENLTISDVFRGVEKGFIGNEWVKS